MKRVDGKGEPLVSIITPSYNQGRFIKQTIDSVLSQDYPAIEYIVVDGGSNDETLDILKSYGRDLKWISEKDSGQSDAIGKGFEMSNGDILAWLNSDDTYLDGAVSKSVEYLVRHPEIGLLYGKSYYVDEQGVKIGEYPTGDFDMDRLAYFNFISQPSVFFRKEVYIKAGKIDKELSYSMDYDLWVRMAKRCAIKYLPDYLSCYRLHGESKTISLKHSAENSREALKVPLEHYRWAPLSRVYAYRYYIWKSRMPALFTPFAVMDALMWYIKLNKGIDRRDFKALSLSNFKKFFSKWDVS